ncbi:glutathione S-transferase family protein [Archangium lansingense]|uniref:Glutathione S-transferase n=1 Tax=Archangium lansingense TaxID=2995310 RepID=A0ABT4A3S9_9BACT|nr:glutathione S-transferase [Archangium lansinium]MCY1076300.1 glutathione S-transferase [Archangium lansinium]
MLKLHHLVNSRSQRILWLLEELGLDYELVVYPRDPKTNFAPPELKAIHPLGKSPVLEDNGRLLAESGAIIDIVVRRYGQGRLAPAPDSAEYDAYVHWLHYAEGSAMVPLLLSAYVGRLGEAGAPLKPRISSEVKNHFGYISGALGERDYLVDNSFSAADIQMSFVLESARPTGALESFQAFPNLGAYLERLHARPAYQRALQRGRLVNTGDMGKR